MSVSTVDLTCDPVTSVSERVLNGLFVDSDGASPSRRRSGRLCAREQSPAAEASSALVVYMDTCDSNEDKNIGLMLECVILMH